MKVICKSGNHTTYRDFAGCMVLVIKIKPIKPSKRKQS